MKTSATHATYFKMCTYLKFGGAGLSAFQNTNQFSRSSTAYAGGSVLSESVFMSEVSFATFGHEIFFDLVFTSGLSDQWFITENLPYYLVIGTTTW